MIKGLIHKTLRADYRSFSRCLGTVPAGSVSGSYLHESDTPTDALQESLPRLPIPTLNDSCNRYLTSQIPLLTPEEHNNTSKIVRDFQNGIGKDLAAELLAREPTLDRQFSYIHHAWKDMYQSDRGSVLLNMNPVLTYQPDKDPVCNNQLSRATRLVTSTLRYFCTLRDGKLLPINTCMLQFPYLFQSTRIPQSRRDVNRRFPGARHLAVLHRGHLYSVDVLDSAGNIRDSSSLNHALDTILSDPRPPNQEAFGYFTALEREDWAAIRPGLESSNTEMLKILDEAIFVLCLDDHSPISSTDVLKNGLVGEGYNRWFDKSFSLIVTKNGAASVNWEHSWGDGVTIMNMINEVYTDYLRERPVKSAEDVRVSRVDPVMTESLAGHVQRARDVFHSASSGYEVEDFNYAGFGKKAAKKFGLSPDSVSQLLFQMAYWRTHGGCVGTYESCSTAHYRSGRTETIRSCTAENKTSSMVFDHEHPANLMDIEGLLKQNSTKHVELCKDAGIGQGFDRHFYAMRALNKEHGREELEVFREPNWSRMATIGLSTSTVASPALGLYLCFGAVSPDGYGLGYQMTNDSIGAAVSCYTPHEHYSDFLNNLQTSAQDIHAVLEGKNFKPSRRV